MKCYGVNIGQWSIWTVIMKLERFERKIRIKRDIERLLRRNNHKLQIGVIEE
jgi:hypothetical protein